MGTVFDRLVLPDFGGFICGCRCAGLAAWTWPLMIVGVNSIAIYCMSMLLKPWVAATWKIHLGPRFSSVGSAQ